MSIFQRYFSFLWYNHSQNMRQTHFSYEITQCGKGSISFLQGNLASAGKIYIFFFGRGGRARRVGPKILGLTRLVTREATR